MLYLRRVLEFESLPLQDDILLGQRERPSERRRACECTLRIVELARYRSAVIGCLHVLG